jgi:hypothetical protein
VTEMNTRLIRTLQFTGLFFAFGAGFVAVVTLVTDLPWNSAAALLFTSELLICGISFAAAGLMAENPDRTRKLLRDWLVGSLLVLMIAIALYAVL